MHRRLGRAFGLAVVVLALAALLGVVATAQPAFPGGSGQIAFTSDRGGAAELFVMAADGSGQTPLTSFASNPVSSPAWSPDGSKIAFSHENEIFTLDVATQAVAPVTDVSSGDADDREPTWSPDGSMLAFSRGAAAVRGIWRVNADGSGLVRLTDRADRDPAWSPDGGTIAFTREGARFGEIGSPAGEDVYLVNRDGGAPLRLTSAGDASDPTWSPDAREIAYVAQVGDQTDLYLVDAGDPGVGRQVTSDAASDFSPAWSPDGAEIVFERGRRDGAGNEIYVVGANGGQEAPLTSNGDADRTPDWQRVPPAPGGAPTCVVGDARTDEGTGATFEVRCDNPTGDTYSLAYATVDGTAHAGSDYLARSSSLPVPAGQSVAQIAIPTSGDPSPEPHETFTLTLDAPDVTIGRSAATGTIVDDDGFGVAVETVSVEEGDSGSTDVEVDVDLSHAADQPVTVGLVVRTAAARFGEDYELLSPSTNLTFAPGDVRETLTYRVFGDTDLEDDQKLEILPVSRLINDASSRDGGLWIRDDDDTEVSVGDATVTEGDTGQRTASFTVTRSSAAATVSFVFATEGGSATAGDDYVETQGAIAFAEGSLTATVDVPVKGDTLDEPDESFGVRLSNATHAEIVDGLALGTILDDDTQPTLSIDDVPAIEGDTGTTTAQFTVSLSAASGRTVTVDAATADGSATAPDDYAPVPSTTLTFAPGTMTRKVDVVVKGDAVDEADETFALELSSAQNTSLADVRGVGTITDDDAAPRLSISDAVARESDGARAIAVFTVSLSAPSGRTVSVLYATADGSATAPGDYTAIPLTELTFAPGATTRTIVVAVHDDVVLEPDEAFAVELSGAQNAVIDDGRGTATILTDEGPANDSFAAAAPLGTEPVSFPTTAATTEPGEPGLASGPFRNRSMWFRISPGRGGLSLRATVASAFPVLAPSEAIRVSVYRGGALDALTLVAQRATDAFPGAASPGEVVAVDLLTEDNVQVEIPYYVQIVATSSPLTPEEQGTQVELTRTFRPAPQNDDLAHAASLPSSSMLNTSFATTEPGEPGLVNGEPSSRPSVWFHMGANAGHALRLESDPRFPAGHQVAVYRGPSSGGAPVTFGELTLVKRASTPGFPASDPGASLDVALPPPGARTYYVQVLGSRVCGFSCQFFPPLPPTSSNPYTFEPEAGAAMVTDTLHPAPPNDDFDHARALNTVQPAAFDTSFASLEAGEPDPLPPFGAGVPSVWFQTQTPGQPGALRLHAVRSPVADPSLPAFLQLSIYTSPSQTQPRVDDLTPVARETSGGAPEVRLNIRTEPGRTYFIQVSGMAVCGPCAAAASIFPGTDVSAFMPGIGAGTLDASFHVAPDNDRFADATPLNASSYPVDTSFADFENGEPGRTASVNLGSVWFRVSPGLGDLRLHTGSSGPGSPRAHQISVFTGSNPSALTLVGRAMTPGFPATDPPGTPAVDLSVPTACGETYYVQLIGRSAFGSGIQWDAADVGVGRMSLAQQFTPATLANDDFAGAQTISPGHVDLHEHWWTCATAQAGEPAHAGTPAQHSLWHRFTVGSGRVTLTSPGNRVAVYQGPALSSLTGVAAAAAGPVTFDTRGGTFLVAVDGTGTALNLDFIPGDVISSAGRIVTTDDEQPANGATAADPIETTVTKPAPSSAATSIFETQGTIAPSAWTFLSWKVEISAPPLTAALPYAIVFNIDPTLVPPGSGLLQIFRNGVAVPNCAPGAQGANPDPCVISRFTTAFGDQAISVRTSRASEWTLGFPRTTRGTAIGLLRPSSGGDAEFLVASNGATVAGAFTYENAARKRYVAASVSALAIAGNKAWLAGVGADRRPFLAYVEDNGAGSSDRFRLWIGGVEQTAPDGRLRSGDVVLRR